MSVDDAEEGLERIQQRVGELAIIKTSRLLKLTNTPTSLVNTKVINYPRTEANLNIVLTGRPLDQRGASPGTTIAGRAHYDMSRQMNLFAIVSTATNLPTPNIVTHEAAHLLNIKQRGHYHENGHCTYPDCIMQAYHQGASQEDMILRHMRDFDTHMDSLFADMGFIKPRRNPNPLYESRVQISDFCSECSEHLGANAFYLMNLKEGKTIPPGIL